MMSQDSHSNSQINELKIAVMQPYLFPYIGYFQLIKAVDIFVFYNDVNYINKGWINRNRILMNGREHLFTLPLHKASQNKIINEIDIFEPETSKAKLWQLIKQAYKHISEHDSLHSLFREIILYREKNLSDYIIYSLKRISEYLGIRASFISSSEMGINHGLKGKQKILDICKKLGAGTYVNPIGGTEIYCKDEFEAEGVRLCFIKTRDIKYYQLKETFVPNLSIIDVLMFNPKENVREMLHEYELI